VAVRSPDGTTLHAEVFGPDDAPTIVLAHGWTEALRFWIYQIRGLAGDFRIVAYDLRGHGRSEPAATDDYSFDRFGEDVEAVLAACVPEGERVVLVGHSMGAMSIAAWAEHHDVERQVGAVGLLNTGIGDLLPEQLIVPVPRIARRVSEPIARRGVLGNVAPIPRFSTLPTYAAIRYAAYGPDVSPAKVAFYEQMLFECPASVRAASGLAMADMDLSGALPNLTVPALVMCGEADKLTPPSHARRIAEMLPDTSTLVELPATGHMGPLERPDEVNALLRELAERASSAGAGAQKTGRSR
jgi:pimeloyl-ACP methyl ester carboxylesterase